MTERAGAVVVGGGILGCSAALHLLESGVKNVLLLERDELAQATSSAGAGFVGMWGAGYIPAWGEEELELERYGLEFYRRLAQDGYDFSYKRNGNLWAATSDEAWDAFVRVIADHEAAPDKRILSPVDVERVTGIIPSRAVVGGVLHPSGIQVAAPRATAAVADRFARNGGRIELRRPVDRLATRRDRVVGVKTPRGNVEAEVVVLAAGAWTNSLLRELDCWAPMVPLVQSRIVTEPLGVPPTMPTLMLRELSIWLREENRGLLWGGEFQCPPRYAFVEEDPPDRFDQLPLDGILQLRRIGLRAARAIPVLARSRSLTIAQGAPCYTADRRAMVGAVREVDGLYVLGGCNEAGLTHGPGYGKLLAEHITGRAAILTDIDAFRLDRFGDTLTTGPDVVAGLARTKAAAATAR